MADACLVRDDPGRAAACFCSMLRRLPMHHNIRHFDDQLCSAYFQKGLPLFVISNENSKSNYEAIMYKSNCSLYCFVSCTWCGYSMYLHIHCSHAWQRRIYRSNWPACAHRHQFQSLMLNIHLTSLTAKRFRTAMTSPHVSHTWCGSQIHFDFLFSRAQIAHNFQDTMAARRPLLQSSHKTVRLNVHKQRSVWNKFSLLVEGVTQLAKCMNHAILTVVGVQITLCVN